jgi:hypothetical protein
MGDLLRRARLRLCQSPGFKISGLLQKTQMRLFLHDSTSATFGLGIRRGWNSFGVQPFTHMPRRKEYTGSRVPRTIPARNCPAAFHLINRFRWCLQKWRLVADNKHRNRLAVFRSACAESNSHPISTWRSRHRVLPAHGTAAAAACVLPCTILRVHNVLRLRSPHDINRSRSSPATCCCIANLIAVISQAF